MARKREIPVEDAGDVDDLVDDEDPNSMRASEARTLDIEIVERMSRKIIHRLRYRRKLKISGVSPANLARSVCKHLGVELGAITRAVEKMLEEIPE